MKNIKLLYLKNDRQLSKGLWDELLALVPVNKHNSITKFLFWKDQQFSLFGKLMLNNLLHNFFEEKTISDIQYTKYNKPYLEGDFSFNISHSKSYILLAYSKENVSIGVDIEYVNEKLDVKDFENILTKGEQELINKSEKPIESFYNIWTCKEAVIKADGRGLNLPLKEIDLTSDKYIKVGLKKWYPKEIFIEKIYKAHVVTNIESFKVEVQELSIEDLYKNKIKKLTNINQ